MAKVTFSIEGGKELRDALDEVAKTIGAKHSYSILRKAARESVKPMLKAAKQYAPKSTGRLRSSLRIVSRVYKKEDKVVAWVEPNPKKFPKDYAAFFIEFGHRVGPRKLGLARKWVEPIPFLRRAFDDTKAIVEKLLVDWIRFGIDRAWAKNNQVRSS